MCGICGIYDLAGRPADGAALARLRTGLAHRGPDDEGEFRDGRVALGFRRLAILDPAGGHQPMVTPDGRFAAVLNGEIYNHLELRPELEASGTVFRTRSDAETLLHLFARQGVACLERLNGMFAFAVWDRQRSELTVARDPVGVKPLYYGAAQDRWAFSSELRSLLAGGFGRELDEDGVIDYLAYAKAHAPRTVVRGVLKLRPGHFLSVTSAGVREVRYWTLPPRPARPPSLGEALERLDGLLFAAVRGNTLSDVPLGAFLSGGVDSGLIAAMMARHFGAAKFKTFSVGFADAAPGVDERAFARAIASHLGTDHQELVLPPDVLGRLDESIDLLDEPIGDSAILPTFLLSRFAKQTVKVVLSGEGADELFAGYDRYKAAWLNGGLKSLPGWARGLAAPVARRLGKGRLFGCLPVADASSWAKALAHSSAPELREILSAPWAGRASDEAPAWSRPFAAMECLEDALAFDLGTVLPDALLMKTDKSTMRAGLEARVPFLDRPVVEFASSLPSSHKIRLFKGKYVLRRLAARYLPAGLAWRRKHGFIVPWERWVRSPKNELVRALLSDTSFAGRRIFDHERLRSRHERLMAGDRTVDAGLFFRIIVLGLWLESVKKEGVSL